MINEYNSNQMKITSNFNQEIEVIKRKSENGDDDEENFCVKKSKADESSNDIISKHAKYFK